MKTSNPVFIISNSVGYGNSPILDEFLCRDEFDMHLVIPETDENNNINLQKTIRRIIESVIDLSVEYVLICRDGHRFSDHYSKAKLADCIDQARKLEADILCGGLFSFRSAIRVSKDIFWVEDFAGLPFTVVFRSFFNEILTAEFSIFPFTDRKFFIYPFIGISKENQEIDISVAGEADMFLTPSQRASAQVQILENVSIFYEEFAPQSQQSMADDIIGNICIPTYVINLPERTERLDHIKRQFEGKHEFDIRFIEACRNRIGAVGLWESIRKIINMAIDDQEDVVIICEDDHEFTANYSRKILIENIVEAAGQQSEMISGGICEFHKALPISPGRAWVSTSYCTQFIVLYKTVFKKILDEPYDVTVTADAMLSKLLVNKMVFYPFISVQKPFGYSDVTKGNHENNEHFTQSFYREKRRLDRIFEAKKLYTESKRAL